MSSCHGAAGIDVQPAALIHSDGPPPLTKGPSNPHQLLFATGYFKDVQSSCFDTLNPRFGTISYYQDLSGSAMISIYGHHSRDILRLSAHHHRIAQAATAELHIDLQGRGGQNFGQMHAFRKDGLLWPQRHGRHWGSLGDMMRCCDQIPQDISVTALMI